MSTTEQNAELELEQPPADAVEGRTSHERTFDVELAEGDGRTIDARIAPYDAPALVADPPDYRPYREAFARGAFEPQLRAAHSVKVWLNFEHDRGLRGIVGHATELVDREDGLHASFRVHENVDGDKALQLVNDGLLTGLSLEFAALRSKVADGIVTRVRAHIDKVSLCRSPAYPQAQVLAVREEPSGVSVVEFDRPAPLDEDRLAALGVDTKLRAIVNTPWDGSPSRWADAAAYCAACLIDDNPAGEPKVIARCHLPIREPGSGDVNANAVRNAMARVMQVQTSAANKTAARRRLEQLMSQIQNARA